MVECASVMYVCTTTDETIGSKKVRIDGKEYEIKLVEIVIEESKETIAYHIIKLCTDNPDESQVYDKQFDGDKKNEAIKYFEECEITQFDIQVSFNLPF